MYHRFKTLSETASPVTRKIMERKGFFNTALLTNWEEIVGKVLAQNTRPTRVIFPPKSQKNGTLHLVVTTGYALEVQHLEPQIIEKLNMYYGFKAIDRLAIKQTMARRIPTNTPPKEATKKQRKGDRLPADAYKDIENEALRDALKRLGDLV
ncbi:MAG: DUF721 domain-containing protein [Alphaproteobacteria bacterium]